MSRITVTQKVHFRTGSQRRKELQGGPPQHPKHSVSPGRVPRVSRLMALAIRFDRLVRDGAVADYAEIARLGHVTRARLTQIMNLLNLASDIQETILLLPPVDKGRDPGQSGQPQPTRRSQLFASRP